MKHAKFHLIFSRCFGVCSEFWFRKNIQHWCLPKIRYNVREDNCLSSEKYKFMVVWILVNCWEILYPLSIDFHKRSLKNHSNKQRILANWISFINLIVFPFSSVNAQFNFHEKSLYLLENLTFVVTFFQPLSWFWSNQTPKIYIPGNNAHFYYHCLNLLMNWRYEGM